jgi:hypothetical protein
MALKNFRKRPKKGASHFIRTTSSSFQGLSDSLRPKSRAVQYRKEMEKSKARSVIH